MRVHLVSFATTKYRHRQILLAASAKANGIVATTTSWTLAKLKASEFPILAPDISPSERGSGFWAWKPFIIQKSLDSVPEGDIVFYCDVGRKYPYILLEHPLDSYMKWMDEQRQDIMPGVVIPWNGPMAMWTKRDAFIGTAMDTSDIRSAYPVQASFSFWRANSQTRTFVAEWLSWCVQRRLVSDDPSEGAEPERPEFRSHRHDQSLLTLCAIKHGVRGIDLGMEMPSFNERDPGQLSNKLFGTRSKPALTGRLIRLLATPFQAVEKMLRERISFGKNYE